MGGPPEFAAFVAARTPALLRTAYLLTGDWAHPYTRETAAYPVASLRHTKYWSPVGRVDNVYGDRNLFCSCVPVSELA